MKLIELLELNGIIIDNIDWVAFDVFDTILFRMTSPMETHHLWACRIKQKYQLSESCDTIVKMKFSCARKLKLKNLIRGYDKEYRYSELVELLHKRLGIKDSLEGFLNYCVDSEYEIELKTTYIPKHIYEWLKDLKNVGKKIICISDYYLPCSFLMKLLKGKGIDVERVFSSTDYFLQKRTGRLYKKVVEELSTSPDRIVMIGDTYLSDFVKARKCGIRSLLVDRNTQKTIMNGELGVNSKQLLSSQNMGIANVPFARVAYLMFLFANRLYVKLKNDGRDYVMFMSREGEFFKKIFDAYQAFCVREDERIRTHYFYVSRRATLIPSVHAICCDSFMEIYRNYNNIRPSVFFKNLQLDNNEKIKAEFKDLLDVDMEIERFSQSREYQRILSSSVFAEECLKKAKEQRDLLMCYIDSFGEDITRKGINLVDVGYGGTTQNNLFAMFEGKVNINGYYMFSRASDSTDMSHKDGIIYDINRDKKENIFIYNSAVIEMLCLASHCGVDSYKEEDGRIVPLFHYKQDELDCYREVISGVQSVILKVFCQIALIIKNARLREGDYFKLFEHEYQRFIFNPSIEEMNLYLKIPFEDNFAIYRTYMADKESKKHKMISFRGLSVLLASKFGVLKSQNTHWIAAAAYKLDMRILNYIMFIFPNITMKGFDFLKQKTRKNKGL